MDDKHCDMCGHYRADNECIGRCTKYHEDHYPDDGEGCPGWVYWEEYCSNDDY